MHPIAHSRALPLVLIPALLLALVGCTADVSGDDPEAAFSGGGAPFDEVPHDVSDGKADRLGYEMPENLPELVDPEVIVSLDGLTVHLFDRATGESRVYEVGVGRKGSSGRSFTPTGHFTTNFDPEQSWWNIDARWYPEYYMGLPFLRLSVTNSVGAYTYGFHGPVTQELQVGYVSAGCIRMHPEDIVEMYWLLKPHPGTPVTIQREVEIDAAGEEVVVGGEPALPELAVAIEYGASVGPRDIGFVGEACEVDADCGHYEDAWDAFCVSGRCSQRCDGYCPERFGRLPTFCTDNPQTGDGMCVVRADDLTGNCAGLDGTERASVGRYIEYSDASERIALSCIPVLD